MNIFYRNVFALMLMCGFYITSTASDLPVGALGSWQSSSELITARSHHGVAHYNGYVYAVGGNGENPSVYSDDGQPLSSVEFAKVNADGTVGQWKTTTSLPTPIMDAGVVAHNGYIYIAGGSGSLRGNQTNNVYYAAINESDGSLGAWKATSPMITARKWFNLAVINNNIYAVGGGYGVTNKVEFVSIKNDGSLSFWASRQNLPQFLWGVGLAAVNGKLYALGGYSASGAGKSVYYTDVNEDDMLAGWKPGPSLPTNAWGMGVAATDLEIYVLGGAQNGGDDASPVSAENSSIVYVGEVEANGSIKQWTATNGLLAKSQALGGFSNGQYVYAIGGTTSGSSQDPVKTAQFAKIEGQQNHIPKPPVLDAPTISYSPGEPWSVAFKMQFNPNYSHVSEYGFEITPKGGSETTTVGQSTGHAYSDNKKHTVISSKQNVSPANTKPKNSTSDYTVATVYNLKGYVKVGAKKYYSNAVTYANISPIAVEYVSHTSTQLTFNFLVNASRMPATSFTSTNTSLACDKPVGDKTISSFVGQQSETIDGASYVGASNTVTIPNIPSSTKVNCDVIYNPGSSGTPIVTDDKTDMDIN